MKNKRRHWLDLEKKERKDLKKIWNKSLWHKALLKSFLTEGDIVNFLLAGAEFFIGILIFAYFEIIHINTNMIYLICSVVLTIFIPAFFISGVNYEEREFKKWLEDKHNVIK